jgi:hypothetical protein
VSSSKDNKPSSSNKDNRNHSQSLAIIIDEPLRASVDVMLPTPSSHTESKDSARGKDKYQVDIPLPQRLSTNDDLLHKIENEKNDFTE